MEGETFGRLLSELLGGLPVGDFALAIHVDRSVIYKWLRDERTPRLNSPHLANITARLGLDAHGMERLRQAQITSLSAQAQTERQRPRAAAATRSAVSRFIERTLDAADSASASDTRHRVPTPPLPRHGTVARGRDKALRTAIDLLAHAARRDLQPTGAIQLSMQGMGMFEGLPKAKELDLAWRSALRAALRRGWEIDQLWRLDKNIDRSLQLVATMLDLVGMGGYHPHYFSGRSGVLRPPYDVLVIPGSAALLLFATEQPNYLDRAILLSEPEQVELVCAHFAQLRAQTKPLLRGFMPQVHEMAYTRELVDAEARPGGRLLIKDGPGGLTYPPAWLREDSRWMRDVVASGSVSAVDLPEYLACLRRRAEAFQTYVREYDYYDICSRRAIERLADTGEYPQDMPRAEPDWPLELRIEHLEHIVALLRSHERYHLALLDTPEETDIPTKPFLTVTGDRRAYMGTWTRDAAGKAFQMDIEITEPTIVAALREQYGEWWERIPERHRDRDYVIDVLEQYIRNVRRRLPAPAEVEAHDQRRARL
jgi:hypothetical protein